MYKISNVYKKDNLILAFDRLLSNPESTYKNYFRNAYFAYGIALESNIAILQKKIKSGYLPLSTIRSFMPKANGLSRMYTLMSIEDQIVYQAYANIVSKALSSKQIIRKRYKNIVFGNLPSSSESIYFYRPWQDSYKAYTKSIIKAYQNGNKYIASFDLTACYDSINHHLLWNILKDSYHFSESCTNQFIQLIEKWESSDGLELGTGIPQGPLASGIIAEIVLAEYDSLIESLQKNLDFKYYRYVDDIKILSNDESTVRWVLFLLDKKSKELGFFPQSTKITIHEISNIDDEIKRISKPLFGDDFDDDRKSAVAVSSIRQILKKNSDDITTIKRYFQYIKQDAKSNRVAITAISKFPNLIHSFTFYIKRYPRKLPVSLTNYIYNCCNDKTQQFSAGVLLESSIGKFNDKDAERFLLLSKKILDEDKKYPYICDSRFKSQLLCVIILYGKRFGVQQKNCIKKSDWWVQSNFIYQAYKYNMVDKVEVNYLSSCLQENICDISIAAASCYLVSNKNYNLPKVNEMSSYSQNIFKAASLIQRSQYSCSQINRYLRELTNVTFKFRWKKALGKEHNYIERTLFTAICYWNTDLTAFVNIWDTLDDKMCSLLVVKHAELGGYTLGKVGGIKDSNGFKNNIPKFHCMCMAIHEMRLSSYLSHSEIKNSHKYTGPIPQKMRKQIIKLITEGIEELIEYW